MQQTCSDCSQICTVSEQTHSTNLSHCFRGHSAVPRKSLITIKQLHYGSFMHRPVYNINSACTCKAITEPEYNLSTGPPFCGPRHLHKLWARPRFKTINKSELLPFPDAILYISIKHSSEFMVWELFNCDIIASGIVGNEIISRFEFPDHLCTLRYYSLEAYFGHSCRIALTQIRKLGFSEL